MTKGKLDKSTRIEVQTSAVIISKTKPKARVKKKTVKSKVIRPLPALMQSIPEQLIAETPKIGGYALTAEGPKITTLEEFERRAAAQISAQELLDKPLEEIKQNISKREEHNMLQDLRIITAIMLGKDKNKELAQMLNTDKSFTSKQVKELEEKGLVKREGEGKETRYTVNPFDVMKFLESRVVIKWGKEKPKEPNTQNGGNQNGRT
jgi:predicted transcriptional regulator